MGIRRVGKTSMLPHRPQERGKVSIHVECANVLTFKTDVLILKYAQNLYGADAAVVGKLRERRINVKLPPQGCDETVDSDGALGASSVIFIGVTQLGNFLYPEIRDFARKALSTISAQLLVRSVAFTIHGPGYGLDETEAFESQLAGLLEAIESSAIPDTLETITFVELDRSRADRLKERLAVVLPKGFAEIKARNGNRDVGTESPYSDSLRGAGYNSASKPHVFVAMPFAAEMDDTFHYGIQGASNAAGYLCERADLSAFTGDVLDWVKARIATAELVVADLSSSNPNVYLEVGYAWGCRVPTVLLARETTELKFDVRGQCCIVYKSIKELEGKLGVELSQLRARPPR